MERVKLLKDYPIRADIIIETGSYMHIGESRAVQLANGGFIESELDEEAVKAKQKKKANRINKEDLNKENDK